MVEHVCVLKQFRPHVVFGMAAVVVQAYQPLYLPHFVIGQFVLQEFAHQCGAAPVVRFDRLAAVVEKRRRALEDRRRRFREDYDLPFDETDRR